MDCNILVKKATHFLENEYNNLYKNDKLKKLPNDDFLIKYLIILGKTPQYMSEKRKTIIKRKLWTTRMQLINSSNFIALKLYLSINNSIVLSKIGLSYFVIYFLTSYV